MRALGTAGRTATVALLFVVCFLCVIAYLELVADLSREILEFFAGHALASIYRSGSMVAATVLIFPLCLQSSLTSLRFTSTLSVLSVMALSVVIVLKSIESVIAHSTVPNGGGGNGTSADNASFGGGGGFGPIHVAPFSFDQLKWFPSSVGEGRHRRTAPHRTASHCIAFPSLPRPHTHSLPPPTKPHRHPNSSAFYAMPIVAVAFLCHFNVLPTHCELRRPTRRRIGSVVHLTMLFCSVFYLCE